MKKIVLALSLVLACSSLSFATTQISSTASTTLGTASPVPFKASKDVYLFAVSTGTDYTVVGQHKAATGKSPKGKQHGTTANNPGISEADAGAGTDGIPAAPTLTAGTQGWIQ